MPSRSIFTHFIIATLFSSLSLPLAHAHASGSSSSSFSSHDSRSNHNVFLRRHRAQVENQPRALRRQDASNAAAEYALVGCFSELSAEGTHLLNHVVSWNQTSIQTCVDSCYAAGSPSPYTFAGIIAGTECVCDNAISSLATQVDQSNCQSTCAQGVEGVDGWCGGPDAYQVYYLPSAANGASPTSIVPTVVGTLDVSQAADGSNTQYGLVGCFVDDADDRVLNGATYVDDTVTPQTCSSYCYTQGYPYAGVEFGNECYCGSGLYNLITSDGCTQACSGDSTIICGAPDTITVYQLVSSSTPTISSTPTDSSTDPFSTATNPSSGPSSTGPSIDPFSTDPSSDPLPDSTQGIQSSQLPSASSSPTPSGSVSSSWTSVGCFADDTTNSLMIPVSYIDSLVAELLDPSLMSIEGCTSACASGGFMVAGLEFGTQCYCSNSVPPVQTSIYDCDIPCPVGGGTCGGGLRWNVYGLTA